MASGVCKSIFLSLALLVWVPVFGQDAVPKKHLEHNLQLGFGIYKEGGNSAYRNPGFVLRFSYGLDINLANSLWIMPGIGYRTQGGTFKNPPGTSAPSSDMADVFCQVRYKCNKDGCAIVLGLGPQLSFATKPDKYIVSSGPASPLNGKWRLSRWDVGLIPSVMFRPFKHFQFGVEGSIGLTNMFVQYPEYSKSGTVTINTVMLVGTWCF